MKKRWIPFILICIATAFLAGRYFGATAETDHQAARYEARAALQTTIAVVNADTGVMVNGENQNFSAAIIDTLGRDFVLVSPAMAHMGYNSGMYGAIVTFPSHVSHRVLSFNAHNPEHIRLEFQINPNLTEQDFIEVHSRIMDLQLAINATVAYTYVSSIFEQFHEAQDQVGRVFMNDQAHLDALAILNLQSFTADLQLDMLPIIPMELNAPVTYHFLISVTDFAERVAEMYLNSFQAATEDYLEMRAMLIALTDDFPEQQAYWMQALNSWSDTFAEFGNELRDYSFDVWLHQLELESWQMRASFWRDDVERHQDDLEDWYDRIEEWSDELLEHQEDSLDWYRLAVRWNDDLDRHQDDTIDWFTRAQLWNDDLTEHDRVALEWLAYATDFHDDITEHLDAVITWYDYLYAWSAYADMWFDDSMDFMCYIQTFAEDTYEHLSAVFAQYNYAIEQLDSWLKEQTGYITELMDFVENYNSHVDQLSEVRAGLEQWQDDLDAHAKELQDQLQLLGEIFANLPPLPEFIPDIDIDIDIGADAGASPSNNTGVEWGINDGIDFGFDSHSQLQVHTNHAPVQFQGQGQAQSDWHNELLLAWQAIEQIIAAINTNAPELDYNIPNLTTIIMPDLDLDHNITPPPAISIYRPDNDFDLPDIDFAGFEIKLPEFYGLERPELVEAPPELDTDNPGEVPDLETYQPEEPPRFLGFQPHIAFRPVLIVPDDMATLDAEQPFNPLIGPPPRPDDFWASLNYMHSTLMRFNIDNYLTSAYRFQIQRMLWDYEQYLNEIRRDLAAQFNYNIAMLNDVRSDYTDFLATLRLDAMQAELDTIEQLLETIAEFSQQIENTSADTHYRLHAFVGMMPESRTPIGPNSNLARFTVAPFEFVSHQQRDAMMAQTQIATSMSENFEVQLWIALPALGGVLVITWVSYAIGVLRKKRKMEG